MISDHKQEMKAKFLYDISWSWNPNQSTQIEWLLLATCHPPDFWVDAELLSHTSKIVTARRWMKYFIFSNNWILN